MIASPKSSERWRSQSISGIYPEAGRPGVSSRPYIWALSMLFAVALRESPLPNERGLESLYPVLQLHVSHYAVPAVIGEAIYSTNIQLKNWAHSHRSIHDSRSRYGPCPTYTPCGIFKIDISDAQHFYRTKALARKEKFWACRRVRKSTCVTCAGCCPSRYYGYSPSARCTGRNSRRRLGSAEVRNRIRGPSILP